MPRLRHHRVKYRETARKDRHAVGPQAVQRHRVQAAGPDQRRAQSLESSGRYCLLRIAVTLQYFGQGADGARRAYRLLPLLAREACNERLQLRAGGKLRLLHCRFADPAVREITQAVAHASHVKARELLRLVACADDELSRPPADVDDQAPLVRVRQAVLDAQIDETRLLAARDDFDRKAERGICELEKRPGVLRHAERVRPHCAHGVAVEAAQTLAEALEARQRPLLRVGV
jgi:hypothetical protein